MRIALTALALGIFVAWSTVMYAWVDERQQRHRRRTITALTALRRRVDRELDGIRAEIGVELVPYVPEPPWAPAEPVHLAPIEPFAAGTPVCPSPFPRVHTVTVDAPDPAPATVPIVLPVPEHPATVPAAVVVDAEWAQLMADTDAYLAELRGEVL